MSKKEIDQVQIMECLKKGDITQKEASDILDLSVRQIRRKLKNYIQFGAISLIHKSVDKTSNRKTEASIIKKILTLIKTKYIDFGPTLLSEKLLEHDIKIDHETLRKIMIKNNIHKPRKRKSLRRAWREPKHHEGELIQLDGSFHIWFGDEHSTLIVFIDDATRKIFARFAKESTEGVSETLHLYLKKYGRPIKIYTDRGKVFKVNKSKNASKAKTQFTRMLDELNINISYAYSPQAKGRVERVFRTLQDRLQKELSLKKVNCIEGANAMLDEFLEKFNNKFSVQAKSNEKLFRTIDGYDLNNIICYKYRRMLNNDGTIVFKGVWFQLDKKQKIKIYYKDKIDVSVSFDGTISLWKKGSRLNYKRIQKPEKIIKEKFDKRANNHPKRPKKGHPWKADYQKPRVEGIIQPEEDISKKFKSGHF